MALQIYHVIDEVFTYIAQGEPKHAIATELVDISIKTAAAIEMLVDFSQIVEVKHQYDIIELEFITDKSIVAFQSPSITIVHMS